MVFKCEEIYYTGEFYNRIEQKNSIYSNGFIMLYTIHIEKNTLMYILSSDFFQKDVPNNNLIIYTCTSEILNTCL